MIAGSVYKKRIHLVGIKGTGLSAFAELLVGDGAHVSGSDVAEHFYTDDVLASLGIQPMLFSPDNIQSDIELVIYSAAYKPETHPELLRARELGIPLMSYPEALGAFSAVRNASAVCGVHGKTTTTALAGVLAKAASLPASVLVGSAVRAFGGRSTLTLGGDMFIAETCEYKRHFLNFKARTIVLTSVEPDHQDYYPTYESIREAFVEYICTLPQGGRLIYCADDAGACEAEALAKKKRPDIVATQYGFAADGPYRVCSYAVRGERGIFTLQGSDLEWRLSVPGKHIALDAAAAIALCDYLSGTSSRHAAMREALAQFSGLSRRSEILGEARGILFMDDYAHHPTALRLTIAGLREFYPKRRLVIDFMSHTASRTRALLAEFADALGDEHIGADNLVILHDIYPSAREQPDPAMTGEVLYNEVLKRRARGKLRTLYIPRVMEACPVVMSLLRPNDLFITMGAGDNFRLGQALYKNMLQEVHT